MEFYATCDPDSIPATVHQHVPEDTLLLFPASAYRRGWKRFRIPKIPQHITRTAADCGGFIASRVWGDYRYTPAEYVNWLACWSRPPEWAATMDWCCENELTNGKPGIVRERQARTTDMAHLFWDQFRDMPWSWTPTIQGWTVEDYERHAHDMRPIVTEMQNAYRSQGRPFRVGIGTLCNRVSVPDIHAIVRAVSTALPDIDFHLWGIKLGAMQHRMGLPYEVRSVDSAAWNGLFHRSMHDWKDSGMKKTEYAWRVGYAAYIRKVRAATDAHVNQQMTLFR